VKMRAGLRILRSHVKRSPRFPRSGRHRSRRINAVVGDGGGSRRMFNQTEGSDDSGTWPAPGSSGGDAGVESSSSTCWVMVSDGV
jgi:hypothetical protein